MEDLQAKGISIRVASPKLVMEEAPESYKNVTDVVNTCEFFLSFGVCVCLCAGYRTNTVRLHPGF
ncbi:unnamed protein product [Echinostoma caproni]|uniref:Uncharacterized protein n=1 Tax=Echinostoma caproni TaxID=27848 RepID=A0A3P8LF49_9TREM|nr:unnamed protein product [Echinostoma caproni]